MADRPSRSQRLTVHRAGLGHCAVVDSLGFAGDLAEALKRPAGSAPASGPRRQALRWLSATGLLAAAGCGGGSDAATVADGGATGTGSATGGATNSGGSSSSGGTTGSGSSTTDGGSCSTIPSETAGPYPADGTQASNGRLNALQISGIVRSDIRTSISGAGSTAAGVPLTIRLRLVDSASSCAPLANRAVYLWHCDRGGNYSLYSSAVADLDYLRGVQVSDANGEVMFTSVFPACYSGRWPHIHFEIYPTLTAALDAGSTGDYAKCSQLALPADVCQSVYQGADGYSASVTNLSRVSLASDNVFGDDSARLQMGTVTGSLSAGFLVTLTVGVSGA